VKPACRDGTQFLRDELREVGRQRIVGISKAGRKLLANYERWRAFSGFFKLRCPPMLVFGCWEHFKSSPLRAGRQCILTTINLSQPIDRVKMFKPVQFGDE